MSETPTPDQPTIPTLPPFDGEITPLIRALARALNIESVDAAVGEGDLHLAARLARHLTPTPDLTERAREEAPSPTVDQMRYAWCWYGNPTRQESDRRAEEFDAWLAAHDEQVRREAKAEVWDEAVQATADAVWSKPGRPRWGWAGPTNPYRDGGAR